MAINSALFILNQAGIGPPEGLMITSKDDTWVSLIGTRKDIEAVKMYIYMKTRLMFDPPSNSFLIQAMEKQITELEWRLNAQVDQPVAPVVIEGGDVVV